MPRRVGAPTGLRGDVRRRRRPRHDPAVAARPRRSRPCGGRARARPVRAPGRQGTPCARGVGGAERRRPRAGVQARRSDGERRRVARAAHRGGAEPAAPAGGRLRAGLGPAAAAHPRPARPHPRAGDPPTAAPGRRCASPGQLSPWRSPARGRSGCAAWCPGSCGRCSGSAPDPSCPRAPGRCRRSAGVAVTSHPHPALLLVHGANAESRRRAVGAELAGLPVLATTVRSPQRSGRRSSARRPSRGAPSCWRPPARRTRSPPHASRPHRTSPSRCRRRASCRWSRCRSAPGVSSTSSTAKPDRRTGWPARGRPSRAVRA